MKPPCTRLATSAFLCFTLASSAIRSFAAEPVPPPDAHARDYSTILDEIELKVLTQQYEKALSHLYDSRFELELVANSNPAQDSDQQGRRTLEMEVASRQRKLTVLREWVDNLRHQITERATQLTKRDEARRAANRAAQDPQEQKPKDKPAAAPSASRAEQPPPTRF